MVSIIICTRNRAAYLKETLASFQAVEVPADLEVELLVVDNASTDETSAVAAAARLAKFPVRVLHEPRPGQVHARHTALAHARGSIFVFTDDDVRPSRQWIRGMCEPIMAGRCHGVAGGIALAPHLHRGWMEPFHRAILGSTELVDPKNPRAMTGANMAFSRAVLERVPRFDPELGPGALGFWDDTLFSYQLVTAGYRIEAAPGAVVEHHPDERRLSRAGFMDRARVEGRSSAYVAYHWKHQPHPAPRRNLAWRLTQLAYWRARKAGQWTHAEGMPLWEIQMLQGIHAALHHLRVESRRPRNYEKHGLIKRS